MQEANGSGGEKGTLRGKSEREKREKEKRDQPSAVLSVLPQSVISGVPFFITEQMLLTLVSS